MTPARVVASEAELRELYGRPGERAIAKEQSILNEDCRAFIAHSPFLVLGTAGADGRCDVSPKGDAPGFVHVLDERHLAIPDRLGNNRLDGMRNVVENPHVGLIFFIPGREDTLRVNGRAWLTRDERLLDAMIARGKRPSLAIGVEVEEAYLHCAKAFKRSGLWDAASWPARAALPSLAQMLLDQVGPCETTLDELERRVAESYASRLY